MGSEVIPSPYYIIHTKRKFPWTLKVPEYFFFIIEYYSIAFKLKT